MKDNLIGGPIDSFLSQEDNCARQVDTPDAIAAEKAEDEAINGDERAIINRIPA